MVVIFGITYETAVIERGAIFCEKQKTYFVCFLIRRAVKVSWRPIIQNNECTSLKIWYN
jgi:hypothetical protein